MCQNLDESDTILISFGAPAGIVSSIPKLIHDHSNKVTAVINSKI